MVLRDTFDIEVTRVLAFWSFNTFRLVQATYTDFVTDELIPMPFNPVSTRSLALFLSRAAIRFL